VLPRVQDSPLSCSGNLIRSSRPGTSLPSRHYDALLVDAADGAIGETRESLAKVLEVAGLDPEERQLAFVALKSALQD
jgi:hypothetical protein